MGRKKMVLKGWLILAGLLILAALRTSTSMAFQCQADINGDGKVDFKDLEIMKAEMGRDNCYTVSCKADLNGDGKVDIKDREIVKGEYGRDDCPPHGFDLQK